MNRRAKTVRFRVLRHYLAYTPGNPGSAHLYPYETTPINAYLCPPTGIINGPPESPTNEEKS